MRLSYLVAPLFTLSAVTLAAPNPDAAPVAEPQFPGLGDLSNTLSALETLLSGTTLNNIVSLIDNAAALLTPQFVNETQTLISTVIAVSIAVFSQFPMSAKPLQVLPELSGLLGSLGGSSGGTSTTAATTATTKAA